MTNRCSMTGRITNGPSDAIWEDGEWISWEWINQELYNQELKTRYPKENFKIIQIFEELVDIYRTNSVLLHKPSTSSIDRLRRSCYLLRTTPRQLVRRFLTNFFLCYADSLSRIGLEASRFIKYQVIRPKTGSKTPNVIKNRGNTPYQAKGNSTSGTAQCTTSMLRRLAFYTVSNHH